MLILNNYVAKLATDSKQLVAKFAKSLINYISNILFVKDGP